MFASNSHFLDVSNIFNLNCQMSLPDQLLVAVIEKLQNYKVKSKTYIIKAKYNKEVTKYFICRKTRHI